MHTRLTCSFDTFTQFQNTESWRRGRSSTWATPRVHDDPERIEFLVCPRFPAPPMPERAVTVLLRSLGPDADLLRGRTAALELSDAEPPFLLVDIHPESVPAAWWIEDFDHARRIDCIAWVGAGMRRIERSSGRRIFDRRQSRSGRRSRTIGALGGDPRALARLQQARFAVVGCGRNGALLATQLAAIGVREGIALIDDDLVEAHNADAMGLDPYRWIGERKVDAVADSMHRQLPQVRVDAIFESASHPRALRAMADADMILSSVDHGQARTLAATVAASCLKPMVDVGTAVQFEPPGTVYGCDVRLVLPGRCLLCWGGVDDPLAPRDTLWFRRRAGSLRSLNSIGTGLAQLLVEQFFLGTEMDNVWMQIRYGPQGITTRQQRAMPPRFESPETPACPICARMAQGPSAVGLDPGRMPVAL